MSEDLGAWVPLDPVEVRRLLHGYRRPWWIAGGWAIDMFLRRKTREHGDIDVGFLHRDALELQATFHGWDLRWAVDGALTPWRPGDVPTPAQDNVWARPTPEQAWAVQLMLNPGDDATWVYHRNPSVTRPLADVIRHSADGIPYLAPEVQLLYKSPHRRDKDDADFDNVLPRLDDAQRSWLRRHLPDDHAWRESL